MSEIIEDWRKWVPVVDALVFQAFYRVLGIISVHAPIDEVFYVAQEIANSKRGGTVYWQPGLEGRVFRWDNVEISPGIVISIWFVGSAIIRKNTTMIRRGWWSLYLLQATRAMLSE